VPQAVIDLFLQRSKALGFNTDEVLFVNQR
jgi:hypothetical protein